MPEPRPTGESTQPDVCPRCQRPNHCALAKAPAERPAECWCVARSFPRELLDSAPPTACICERCLDEHS